MNAASITRSSVVDFQDEMDMNITRPYHVVLYQDEMDMNLTRRHHITTYQTHFSNECSLSLLQRVSKIVVNFFTGKKENSNCSI